VTADREEPLAGGNISGVVRVRDTVRRVTGPWTPAVHALLHHLERVGFDGAPRVLGIDEQGREILTYLEGHALSGWPEPYESWVCDDETLVSAAVLLRRYHDAVEGFMPPKNALWRYPAPPGRADLICHNDFGAFNVVFRARRAAAMFDWDHATPGTRAWDVAYGLWRWSSLTCGGPDLTAAAIARRAAVFCRAYGDIDPAEVVDAVPLRIRHGRQYLEERAAAGDPPFVNIWSWGVGPAMLADAQFYETNRALFLNAFRRPEI
jgi:hypothetical protein